MIAIDLKGKSGLVCGAGDGIGKAVAEAFHRAGARVVGLSRTAAKVDKTICEEVLEVDLADIEMLRHLMKDYIKDHGPFHILVNNSGGPPPGTLLEADVESFLMAFRQHVIAAQTLAQLLLPGMAHEGYGRVINIISTSVRAPIPGLGVSNTIRGAMASWAKTLSREWASQGITVNNILPGATRTPRLRDLIARRARSIDSSEKEIEAEMLAEIPAGRFAEPWEPAALAAFLASPLASYITGVSIAVDGGRTPCL